MLTISMPKEFAVGDPPVWVEINGLPRRIAWINHEQIQIDEDDVRRINVIVPGDDGEKTFYCADAGID